MTWKWLNKVDRRFLILAMATLMLNPVGWAQLDPPEDTSDVEATAASPAGKSEDVLASWWRDYQLAKQNSDVEGQERAYQNFRDLKQTDQSEIFELGSYLFLREGFADLERQRFNAARKEFHQALELNPYLWPARMGLANIKREKDGDYGRFIHLNYEGLIRAFNPKNTYFVFDGALWLYSNVLRVFYAIFLSLVLLFGVKYCRSFYATTVAAFEHRGMKPLYAELATMAVIVFPLVLGLNIVLAAGLFLALLFPFLEGREKHIGVVALLGWLLVPLTLLMMTHVFRGKTNPILAAHLSQYYQGDHAAQIERLTQLVNDGELKNRSKMLLGKHYKASGQLLEAVDAYESVPRSSDYYRLAQVNRGNLHVLAKEYQQAIKLYKSVTGENVAAGLALYNLSVVKAILGNHEESESYRSQALAKSPKLGDQMGLFENVDERFLIDGEPDPVARVGDALLGKGNPIYQGWYSRPDFLFMGLAGLALLFLGWLCIRVRNMRAQAKPCMKCGMTFFISDSPNGDWCTQCVSLYIRKEDLPSDAKIKKSEQVQRYTKVKRYVYNGFQLILPGAKQIFRGQPGAGFITMCAWLILVVMCLYPITRMNHAFMHYFDWPSFWLYLTLGVTTVYWLIFGLRGIWQED